MEYVDVNEVFHFPTNPAREIGVACATIASVASVVAVVMSAGMGVVLGCLLFDSFLIWTLYAEEQPESAVILTEYDDV